MLRCRHCHCPYWPGADEKKAPMWVEAVGEKEPASLQKNLAVCGCPCHELVVQESLYISEGVARMEAYITAFCEVFADTVARKAPTVRKG